MERPARPAGQPAETARKAGGRSRGSAPRHRAILRSGARGPSPARRSRSDRSPSQRQGPTRHACAAGTGHGPCRPDSELTRQDAWGYGALVHEPPCLTLRGCSPAGRRIRHQSAQCGSLGSPGGEPSRADAERWPARQRPSASCLTWHGATSAATQPPTEPRSHPRGHDPVRTTRLLTRPAQASLPPATTIPWLGNRTIRYEFA